MNTASLHAGLGAGIHALGLLGAARRAEVEDWLNEHPDMRQTVAEWRIQSERLHRIYDPVLEEAVPARLIATARTSSRIPLRLAAAIAWLSKRLDAELLRTATAVSRQLNP